MAVGPRSARLFCCAHGGRVVCVLYDSVSIPPLESWSATVMRKVGRGHCSCRGVVVGVVVV